jgi:hypothetical protein
MLAFFGVVEVKSGLGRPRPNERQSHFMGKNITEVSVSQSFVSFVYKVYVVIRNKKIKAHFRIGLCAAVLFTFDSPTFFTFTS